MAVILVPMFLVMLYVGSLYKVPIRGTVIYANCHVSIYRKKEAVLLAHPTASLAAHRFAVLVPTFLTTFRPTRC